MKIQLVYTGRSYETADSLPEQITLQDGAGIDEALRSVQSCLPEGRQLPDSCLISVDGQHLGTLASHGDCALRDGSELVLIAPVAGG